MEPSSFQEHLESGEVVLYEGRETLLTNAWVDVKQTVSRSGNMKRTTTTRTQRRVHDGLDLSLIHI